MARTSTASGGEMSRLVRMDHTGHTTLAEWSAADAASVEAAVAAFRTQLEQGAVPLQRLALPVSLIALAKAWIIPELYAQRGANVVRSRAPGEASSERRALGLLGDLVGHDARALLEHTGLVIERGLLGVWLVG